MKKKDLWVIAAVIGLVVLASSCQISNQELGEDLLPPGDNVFLFNDTIFDIHAYPVRSSHVATSEINNDPDAHYLLGNWQDTIGRLCRRYGTGSHHPGIRVHRADLDGFGLLFRL